ncbi:YesL family protein [Gracilibacillus sp. S3-1-1]|uniref:YesL family protein n=1 Tax=Gracilibacillus pellucidus TaxID=3095368 RepID=A0ACC6M184_9BACI|nr:YesL family protein [Gracilibacillus sp. S3-1-1]MDX8044695.1 YesL family protein [Gracilibacillus sp. S3-1-1]
MSALNKALEWVTKVAYLNLLWIVFSVLGFIIFSLFPATAATFSVTRKWITGSTDISLFKTFWQAYRQSILQANIIGYIVLILGYILYLDFLFITVVQNDYLLLLTIPFLFVTILVTLTSLYLFPVYAHYDMKVLQVMKSAFFIMIINPLQTIVMVLGVFAILFGVWHFQWLGLFFSMSLVALSISMPAQKAFRNIEEKKNYIVKKTMLND